MLFEPVRVNVSVSALPMSLRLSKFVACMKIRISPYGVIRSNTSCVVAGRPLLRDFSVMYAERPLYQHNYSDLGNSGVIVTTWRDPMQV